MSHEGSRIHNTAMAIYAILFAFSEPLEIRKIKKGLNISDDEFDGAIDKLQSILKEHSPLMLQHIEDSVLLVTRPEYADPIRQTIKRQRIRLSDEAIETLTIIAYHQPITRAEIEEKRQRDCESVIDTLVRYRLIETIGELSRQGSPLLYKTTTEFLRHFGLKSLSELPRIT